MSNIWLFIFALAAICKLANADDYDYDGLVSEEPMQVIFYEIHKLFLQINQKIKTHHHSLYLRFIGQTVTETI